MLYSFVHFSLADAITYTLLNILEGHTDIVRSVAWSPDNKIVSGSNDNTVRLWLGETNSLKSHSGSVISVVFSPDGSKVISGSKDKTLCIWDLVINNNVINRRGWSELRKDSSGKNEIVWAEPSIFGWFSRKGGNLSKKPTIKKPTVKKPTVKKPTVKKPQNPKTPKPHCIWYVCYFKRQKLFKN